jgi:hypothetical protein
MSSIYLLFWKYINSFQDYIKNIFFIFLTKYIFIFGNSLTEHYL